MFGLIYQDRNHRFYPFFTLDVRCSAECRERIELAPLQKLTLGNSHVIEIEIEHKIGVGTKTKLYREGLGFIFLNYNK